MGVLPYLGWRKNRIVRYIAYSRKTCLVRNQFSGKVELDVHKTKKAQINYETLRGPTTLFGLGIVKLGQLISK